MDFSHGSCTSTLFAKDVDNMLPFTKQSSWNFAAVDNPRKHTTHPIVTGSSVLGIAYDKGVMICADTMGSYGSLARYFDCPRVLQVNKQIILGAEGDYADFQYLTGVIEQQIIDEECLNDGFILKPKSLYTWLTRALYNRRSKFDPLWNVYVVGGMQDDKPFLGYVDKIGTAYESQTIATGFGSHIAQPILRTYVEKKPDLSREEALVLLKDSLRVLYYRDSRAFTRFTLATCTKEGVKMEGPFEIDSDFSNAKLTWNDSA
ncbi:proteasome subunit beta type-4 [Parasteatoda tepidariorum]|uniref:proteasome subunit beta type-4 n=1 Tax=Parasteatoda tepidariorum TaxID=114398 RepID=UPI00077FDC52|nr:proteasome subunit beta type-4 [Parasteatoda tepidariorum]